MTGLSEKRLQLVILHFLFYGGFLLLRSLFEGDLSGFAPILALFLIWISVIDVERLEIPDIASAALFAVGLVVCYLHQLDLLTRLTEAALWMGLFWGVGTGYAKWRDWHGLGFGDVKLIAGLTVWLGFTDTTKAVFAAALSGIFWAHANAVFFRYRSNGCCFCSIPLSFCMGHVVILGHGLETSARRKVEQAIRYHHSGGACRFVDHRLDCCRSRAPADWISGSGQDRDSRAAGDTIAAGRTAILH